MSSNFHTTMTDTHLDKIKRCLEDRMPMAYRKGFVEHVSAIFDYVQTLKNAGAGLIRSTLIDFLFTQTLEQMGCHDIRSDHTGQSDLAVGDIPLSFKTTERGSDLALNWSKNDPSIPYTPPRFEVDVVVYVMRSGCWYTRIFGRGREHGFIGAGVYLIPASVANDVVVFATNNKSNSIIKKKYVFKLLRYSAENGLYIPFPDLTDVSPKYHFDLSKAFSVRER